MYDYLIVGAGLFGSVNIRQSTPRNLEEQALNLVGKDIYEKPIKGYTEKQWGRRANRAAPKDYQADSGMVCV